MEVYTAVCIEDWHIQAENGDRQDCKRGEEYTISPPWGDGTVTVFSGFWVRAPERIFAGAKSLRDTQHELTAPKPLKCTICGDEEVYICGRPDCPRQGSGYEATSSAELPNAAPQAPESEGTDTTRTSWQRFCGHLCRDAWHQRHNRSVHERLDGLERRIKALEEKG